MAGHESSVTDRSADSRERLRRCTGSRPLSTALEGLAGVLGPRVRREVALAPFTAMRVGGPADLLVIVESLDELTRVVRAAQIEDVPFHVLGDGCNVLVSDQGVPGLVIVNRAASIRFEGRTVRAESGTKLARLARRALESNLAGMTWASGLPGTVGGAVVGNAGAFDGDMAGVLRKGTLLGPEGEIVERENAWFGFSYRSSRLKRPAGRGRDSFTRYVVLAATLQLEPGAGADLEARADEVLSWRRASHPSGATMGSTFVNPPDGHAGELIDRAGLKGHRVGGATISHQHANFIVNDGDAKAADVMALVQHVQSEVERRFGVALELEVELLGW